MSEVLQRSTLVLNKNWQPVHVTTVYRAVVMLWSDTAHVVCPESYQLYTWPDWIELVPGKDAPAIRTGKLRIAIPEVVRLGDYDRLPNHAVTFTRFNLIKRDRYTCQYCGGKPKRGELTIDHVLPRSKGGQNTWTNCVIACEECNAFKADRTPEQAGMRLKKRPIQPDWKPFWDAQGVRSRAWDNFIPKHDNRAQMRVFG